MKNLKVLNTSAFGKCSINEFDAPNLNEISVDKDVDYEITFIVGKKNFQDSHGIL